ncbi:Voltage-gated hydrogen channel 1 [Talaromyces pinophilus]|nr:Voltage-gated hydrogen channel 1 [Talaromyces pinophilus]
MASSTDASQPLLGDHTADLENQDNPHSAGDDKQKAKTFPLSASVVFSRDASGSNFIGSLASWSKRGAEGLGISRNNSFYRQQQQQQFNEEYYDDDYYHNDWSYDPNRNTRWARLRAKTRSFLSSKWGHYIVLFMVAVDVACIFADFLIELRVCELRERHQTPIDRRWGLAQEALGLIGLIFSCLFMLELIASVLSFGLSYFRSKFHTFDALVIVLAFILDVALRGVVEELGSLVVVLRLWRVFKIIEEMGEVSAEMMDKYEEELDNLKRENSKLKRKLKGYGSNDEDEDIEGHAGGDEEDINE